MFTTKQNKSVLNSNINFMQLKLHDFSDEKINQEKNHFQKDWIKHLILKMLIIKLFLDENNTFKYDDPICPVCKSHKIIKKGTIKKNKQNTNEKTTEFKEQQYQCKKCGKKF